MFISLSATASYSPARSSGSIEVLAVVNFTHQKAWCIKICSFIQIAIVSFLHMALIKH